MFNYGNNALFKFILTTCPDLPTAHLIAEGLVENNLAVCVNIIPSVVSIYKWQGQVEQSQETQLFIKTDERKVAEIDSFITSHHPYEVPELIVLDITDGAKPYLAWLSQELTEENQ